MDQCPLCNGLSSIKMICPNCKTKMQDGGKLENYYEPYSPYLPEELLNQIDGVSPDKCIHLFYCPHCGYDHRYVTKLFAGPDLS